MLPPEARITRTHRLPAARQSLLCQANPYPNPHTFAWLPVHATGIDLSTIFIANPVTLYVFFGVIIVHRPANRFRISISLAATMFLLYITMGKVTGGTAPIYQDEVVGQLFSNPLPQVLILTAIVVGISTTALGLGIVIRIKEEYGSIEEQDIQEIDRR